MADLTDGLALDELRHELMECRKLLDGSDSPLDRDWFDEFMEHHEFGLAFLIVCDYLLEERAANLDAVQFARIQRLHERMHVDDP